MKAWEDQAFMRSRLVGTEAGASPSLGDYIREIPGSLRSRTVESVARSAAASTVTSFRRQRRSSMIGASA